ncbi:nicotinate (nicotinamide) nucleotide adenylyltransferase [Dissulfurirhabdus thermomarina]|uniref:Probable nicotinate-nucleotide adenylyltransferase n=1 Tax=Dissulfurirhabdus thermomarina TaxID=1765737 RepID=A0A6N9TQC3_DISTH|nr:nicotinate-nucleotide adenylyltransferase [Dissulfurirhabdus thermomarina]NDY43248.1 nicotinate (nicotinamide) nucleotide adenylyltransferase [Dissulfurirhabdus thermomarina]NMX22590.1 nicotinate (nicotinamide) nucleotide adenylyltransferase [Dissulfurirhabdus thermomarina]
MRIGLFGGTFDPIHIGHLRAGEEVWEALGLDEVRFVPAFLPPHKRRGDLTPFGHRLAMVERAVAGVGHLVASAVEAERSGPSFSVETLAGLRAGLGPGPRFFFILGDDAFCDIESWKDYRRLTRYADLVVMGREADRERVAAVIARAFPLHRPAGPDRFEAAGEGGVRLLPVTRLSVSGTDIRRRLAAGRSIRYLVPGPVLRYIEDNGLYRAGDGPGLPEGPAHP